MRGLGRAAIVSTALLLAGLSGPVAGAQSSSVVVDRVAADTYVSGETDETVTLANTGDRPVDLSGWVVRDAGSRECTSNEGGIEFPKGTSIAPGERLRVTGNASAYELDRRQGPDFEWLADSRPDVPQVSRTCGRLVLANEGDEAVVVDDEGSVVDTLVYRSGNTSTTGWNGESVPKPTRAWEGIVLERDRLEIGQGVPDSDRAADWRDPRISTIGQSHRSIDTFGAESVETCTSPDSSFDTLASFVRGANASLEIEIYQLMNTHLLDAFQEALADGVDVDILVEGGPVGMTKTERHRENWILERLVDAGATVRYMVTNDTRNVHDRYDFVHAKTAIRDGESVFVSSGNWKRTGLPVDETYGNREWCTVVHSQGLASYLSEVFALDWDQGEHRDLLDFGRFDNFRYNPPPDSYEPNRTPRTGGYPPVFPSRSFEAGNVTPVLSPDTSLFDQHPRSLRSVIENATDEVLVEQMTLHKHWGPIDGDCEGPCTESEPSLLLESLLDAAENGARVRVLMGSEYIFGDDTRNNRRTMEHLHRIAEERGLDIQAKVFDQEKAELVKVHNKGVIVDDEITYVGSMNWGRASAQDNREIGVLVESRGAARFYENVFWYDWNADENPPPANLEPTDVRIEPTPTRPDAPNATPSLPGVGLSASVADPSNPRVVVNVTASGAYGAADHAVEVTIRSSLEQADTVRTRVDHVPAGQTRTAEIPWDKAATLGTFNLTAVVDADDEIAEPNETDNVLQRDDAFVLPGPSAWLPAGS